MTHRKGTLLLKDRNANNYYHHYYCIPKAIDCNLKRQPDLDAQVGAIHKFLPNRNRKCSKEHSIKVT